MTTYVLRNQNLPETQTIQVFVAAGQTLSLVWATAGWNIVGTTDDLPTETPRGFGPFVTAYAKLTQYPSTATVLLPNGAIATPKAAFTTGATFDPAQWTVINDVGAAVDTGGLVTNNDSRLTDPRTPKPGSVTPSTIQAGGLPQSAIAGLVAALQALSDGKASHADLDAAVTSLIGGAPGILDTLGEITAQLQSDESAAAAMLTLLNLMIKSSDAFATFVPYTAAAPALSASDKAQARANIGSYAKPADGIPTTDLTQVLQNLLGDALTKTAAAGLYPTLVQHGSTANTARPSGALRVFWRGSVQPANAQQYDRWVDTSTTIPTERIFDGAAFQVLSATAIAAIAAATVPQVTNVPLDLFWDPTLNSNAGGYPARSSVTTNVKQRVNWIGPQAPASGGTGSIAGVDTYLATV